MLRCNADNVNKQNVHIWYVSTLEIYITNHKSWYAQVWSKETRAPQKIHELSKPSSLEHDHAITTIRLLQEQKKKETSSKFIWVR